MKHLNNLSILLIIFSLSSCGDVETGFSNKDKEKGEKSEKNLDSGEENQGFSNENKVVYLKDRALIIKSFTNTVGQGKHLDFMNPEEDIFEKFGNQFGGAGEKSFGDIDPKIKENDNQKSYFLALNIIADNAGKLCASDRFKDDEKCKCEDAESAEGFLTRAFPQMNFDSNDMTETVDNFVKACELDKASAIAAPLSSLLFAILN